MIDESPECIHHLRECEQCGGLEILTLTDVPGITGGTLHLGDGRDIDLTGARFYVGPAETPCDPSEETPEP